MSGPGDYGETGGAAAPQLNCQYRKVTKTKSVFPSDSSLEKMLFWQARMWRRSGGSGTATGSSAQPADSPLWVADDTISVKKESLGQGTMEMCRCPQPYSIGIYSIATQSYSRARGKEQPGCFIFGTKNQIFLYKTMGIGNTIIRKINRHGFSSVGVW